MYAEGSTGAQIGAWQAALEELLIASGEAEDASAAEAAAPPPPKDTADGEGREAGEGGKEEEEQEELRLPEIHGGLSAAGRAHVEELCGTLEKMEEARLRLLQFAAASASDDGNGGGDNEAS